MECNFVIGQKVICIVDRSINYWFPWKPIKIGEIVTIREIYIDSFFDEAGLYFKEHINHFNRDNLEYGYLAKSFNPLIEKKTDISVFEKLLLTKENVLEEV